MKVKKILHILRNPYCWSEVEKKQARLEAAEKLSKRFTTCTECGSTGETCRCGLDEWWDNYISKNYIRKKVLRKIVKEAFEAGYESGHNDTVESQYGDAGELADEYVDDLEVGDGNK